MGGIHVGTGLGISTSDIFFIKDTVDRENITVTHCPTEQMIADFFTKPLQGNLFRNMRDIIMGASPYPSKERVEN
mgnify:CR=1 FL=1